MDSNFKTKIFKIKTCSKIMGNKEGNSNRIIREMGTMMIEQIIRIKDKKRMIIDQIYFNLVYVIYKYYLI